MENQHRKIKGCRELSQEEIDLMNRIKAKGDELLTLHEEVIALLGEQDKAPAIAAANEANAMCRAYFIAPTPDPEVLSRHKDAEPRRWAEIGKTDIQTGIMALVRAVSQPAGV